MCFRGCPKSSHFSSHYETRPRETCPRETCPRGNGERGAGNDEKKFFQGLFEFLVFEF